MRSLYAVIFTLLLFFSSIISLAADYSIYPSSASETFQMEGFQENPVVYGDSNAKEFEKTTLYWHGSLNEGSHYNIYSYSCGGILIGQTKSNSFIVTPTKLSNEFFVEAVNSESGDAVCGSFEFQFNDASKNPITYKTKKAQQTNVMVNNNDLLGTYKTFSNGLSLNKITGEVSINDSKSGTYQIYFFPIDNTLGYTITTLDVQNVGTLSIDATTQAAEDLTDGLFTVTASASPSVDVLVSVEVRGTATGGRDYVTISNTFNFPAGQTTVTIPVDVIPDSALEGSETIIIELLSTDNTDTTIGSPNTATMTLSDNDSASVNIGDASGNEDDGAITITATLSNAVQGGFTVDLSTIDASATVADNDYTAITNQTLIFTGTSGETQTLTFLPTSDSVLEGDETLIISMSNLAGTSLPVNITNSAVVTILNDEVDCSSAAAVVANFQTFDSGCTPGNSGSASAVLFYDGFENADLTLNPNEYRNSVDPIPGLPQWRYEGAPAVNARLSVFSTGAANRRNNGNIGLGLDSGNFVPHSIILNLDLSQELGSDDLRFSYASFNSSDENSLDDVVSIRGNVSEPWVLLSDWNTGSNNQWITREADIDAVLTAAGQVVSANTEIRFTQSDNFPFNSDGVIFDDIAIFKENYTYLWSNGETTGVIQNLSPGNYSVDITTPDGCSVTLSGNVGGLPSDDSSFSYSDTVFCQDDTSITPTITGLTGGTFSSTPFGLDINPTTGIINATNSNAGRIYTVTYQTNGPCPSNSTASIRINFVEDAGFGYSSNAYSLADPNQFPTFINTFGGTFSSSPAGLQLGINSGQIDPANSTVGSYTVTYTTPGICAGTSTQQIIINNADVTAPIARCQPFVGQLDADGILTIQAFNVDAGSTDDTGIASLTVSQTTFTCSDLGVNNVTLTVTDASGNTDTCTTTVTVEDVDAPILQCADITIELDENGTASLLSGNFDSADNYNVTGATLNIETLPNESTVSLGDDQVAVNLPIGFNFTFFGNQYTSFDISSNGFIAFTGSFNAGCCQGQNLTSGNTNLGDLIALGWSDLRPSGSSIIGYETLGTAPNRKLVVSFLNVPEFGRSNIVSGQIHLFERTNRIELHTATNTVSRVQTQGILNQNGTIGFPVPGRNATTWNASNDAFAFTPENIFATDNCASPTIIFSQTDFTCADIGVNNVSLSATDAAGNNSSCSFFVTIVDNELPAPTLTTLPDITASCQVTSLPQPGVTDNCASPVNISNNASLPITRQGTTVVTWVYNDGNGNFSFQNQNVIINDVTAPVPDVTNLPDILADCDVNSLIAPTAADASCANGNITVNGTSNTSLPITASGTTVVTWSYNDGNGNVSTQTQNVIINDDVAPVGDTANLPNLNAQCQITTLTAPTATDNCSNNVSISNNATLPITASATVVWTYDDNNGNVATQNQTVTINDTAAPVADRATLPDVQSDCEVISLTPPSATDNCTSTITVSNDVSLPITTQGTTTITWTYTDGNGNSSTQLQNIIINDGQAPVVDVTNLADVTSTCQVTSLATPTATDNCTGSLNGVSDASLPINSQGTTVVTWTYSDGNGNTTTQSQNIIITDNIPPVPDVTSLQTINSQCEVSSLTVPTATDNCAASIMATTSATFPITSGQTTVIWSYDDGNGNVVTQDQIINVNDDIAPTPDVLNLPDVIEQCEVTLLNSPTATDNCSATVVVTNDAILPFTSGSTLVTWTYDDGNGNTSTQTQNVNVSDTIAPTPDLVNLPDVNAQCEVTSLNVPTAIDNCSINVIVTNDAILPYTTGSNLVTWTYDDGNGNTTTQTQNVTVNDDTAPTATCPQDIIVSVTGSTYTVLDYTSNLAATDNCSDSSSLTVAQSVAAGSTVPVPSTNIITVTITDENGNDQVCTFELRVDEALSNGEVSLEKLNINIYPNPTDGRLYINSDIEVMKNIQLVDLRGRLVKSWSVNSVNDVQIDISEFESAIYFVRITTESHTINERIIKN
jgi:hypothetical protein